jgi:hypothetical protein
MGRKPILGELALVHWDAVEAAEFAAELSDAGWRVKTGLGELKAVKANPPVAVVISLRRLPSHGREVADALWYTKWGRAIRSCSSTVSRTRSRPQDPNSPRPDLSLDEPARGSANARAATSDVGVGQALARGSGPLSPREAGA